MNILLVEDQQTHQMIITYMLKGEDWDLDIANNGVEAVELFKNKKYDIILMDLHLPKMSGYQITEEFIKLNPDIPIIAVTAFYTKVEMVNCMEAGMKGYISKPVSKEHLIKTIKEFTNH